MEVRFAARRRLPIIERRNLHQRCSSSLGAACRSSHGEPDGGRLQRGAGGLVRGEPKKGSLDDEAHLATQEGEAHAYPWLSRAHGLGQRTAGSQAPQGSWPQAADGSAAPEVADSARQPCLRFMSVAGGFRCGGLGGCAMVRTLLAFESADMSGAIRFWCSQPHRLKMSQGQPGWASQ